MNRDSNRTLKALVGLVVLVVLFFLVVGWWRDYRQAEPAKSTKGSVTATATPSPEGSQGEKPAEKSEVTPTDSAAPQIEYVVVLIEGLNFRPAPSSDSKPIRGLAEGEKLVLLSTEGSWYQVRADDGTEGWVSSSPQYSRISDQ